MVYGGTIPGIDILGTLCGSDIAEKLIDAFSLSFQYVNSSGLFDESDESILEDIVQELEPEDRFDFLQRMYKDEIEEYTQKIKKGPRKWKDYVEIFGLKIPVNMSINDVYIKTFKDYTKLYANSYTDVYTIDKTAKKSRAIASLFLIDMQYRFSGSFKRVELSAEDGQFYNALVQYCWGPEFTKLVYPEDKYNVEPNAIIKFTTDHIDGDAGIAWKEKNIITPEALQMVKGQFDILHREVLKDIEEDIKACINSEVPNAQNAPAGETSENVQQSTSRKVDDIKKDISKDKDYNIHFFIDDYKKNNNKSFCPIIYLDNEKGRAQKEKDEQVEKEYLANLPNIKKQEAEKRKNSKSKVARDTEYKVLPQNPVAKEQSASKEKDNIKVPDGFSPIDYKMIVGELEKHFGDRLEYQVFKDPNTKLNIARTKVNDKFVDTIIDLGEFAGGRRVSVLSYVPSSNPAAPYIPQFVDVNAYPEIAYKILINSNYVLTLNEYEMVKQKHIDPSLGMIYDMSDTEILNNFSAADFANLSAKLNNANFIIGALYHDIARPLLRFKEIKDTNNFTLISDSKCHVINACPFMHGNTIIPGLEINFTEGNLWFSTSLVKEWCMVDLQNNGWLTYPSDRNKQPAELYIPGGVDEKGNQLFVGRYDNKPMVFDQYINLIKNDIETSKLVNSPKNKIFQPEQPIQNESQGFKPLLNIPSGSFVENYRKAMAKQQAQQQVQQPVQQQVQQQIQPVQQQVQQPVEQQPVQQQVQQPVQQQPVQQQTQPQGFKPLLNIPSGSFVENYRKAMNQQQAPNVLNYQPAMQQQMVPGFNSPFNMDYLQYQFDKLHGDNQNQQNQQVAQNSQSDNQGSPKLVKTVNNILANVISLIDSKHTLESQNINTNKIVENLVMCKKMLSGFLDKDRVLTQKTIDEFASLMRRNNVNLSKYLDELNSLG